MDSNLINVVLAHCADLDRCARILGAIPECSDTTVEVKKAAEELRAAVEAARAEMSEEESDLEYALRGFGKAYPEEIFVPLTKAERQLLQEKHPGLIDRISGAMGRHMAQFTVQAADQIGALRLRLKAAEASAALPIKSDAAADDADADPLYEMAVKVVLQTCRPSISLVQRHLRIGYVRATRLIERMERAGIVSPINGNGYREILAGADLTHQSSVKQ